MSSDFLPSERRALSYAAEYDDAAGSLHVRVTEYSCGLLRQCRKRWVLSWLFVVVVVRAAVVRPVLPGAVSRLPAAAVLSAAQHAGATSVRLLLPAAAAAAVTDSAAVHHSAVIELDVVVQLSSSPAAAAVTVLQSHGADLAGPATGVGGGARVIAAAPAHLQRRRLHDGGGGDADEATTPRTDLGGRRRCERHRSVVVADRKDDVGPSSVVQGPRLPEPRLRQDLQQELASQGAPAHSHGREAVPLRLAWLLVEVRAVRRADASLPQAHRGPAVRLLVL